MLFNAAVVLLFFLMLLAPCLFAVFGALRRDEEEAEIQPLTIAPVALLVGELAAEPRAVPDILARAALQHLAHQPADLPDAELSRAEALRSMLEQAERDAARARQMERALDLDDLRRMVAEAEALTAQLVAAQARASALAAASRAATARANAAAEMAEMAREAAEGASRAAAETRASYARQRLAEQAGAEALEGEKLPDHPAMHYPRARVNRRAA